MCDICCVAVLQARQRSARPRHVGGLLYPRRQLLPQQRYVISVASKRANTIANIICLLYILKPALMFILAFTKQINTHCNSNTTYMQIL